MESDGWSDLDRGDDPPATAVYGLHMPRWSLNNDVSTEDRRHKLEGITGIVMVRRPHEPSGNFLDIAKNNNDI